MVSVRWFSPSYAQHPIVAGHGNTLELKYEEAVASNLRCEVNVTRWLGIAAMNVNICVRKEC
jgi:hypothetical protein